MKSRIIEQAKFSYSLLEKAFEKQAKAIEEQGKKQVEAAEILKFTTQKLTIKDVILENVVKEEAKDELNKIKEIKKTVDRENERTNIYLIFRTFEQ